MLWEIGYDSPGQVYDVSPFDAAGFALGSSGGLIRDPSVFLSSALTSVATTPSRGGTGTFYQSMGHRGPMGQNDFFCFHDIPLNSGRHPARYSSTTLPSAVPPDFTTGMAADSAESESGKSDAELGGAGCAGFVETGEFSE